MTRPRITSALGATARRIGCAMSALLLAAMPAVAQEREGLADRWRFSLTPYVWFAGISGDLSLPRQSRDFDVDFGDTLSALKFGAMGIFEARRGRFGLVVDAVTLTTEEDFSTPRSVLFSSGTSRLTTTEISLIGLVRVAEKPRWNLDLGAGFRGWWIDSKVSLNPGVAPARSASGSANFIDPLLALRYNVGLSERFDFSVYADIGGSDTDSRLTWQVLAALNWQATDSISAHVGYRHISIDVSRGSIDLSTALSGPIIGATFRF